MSSHAGPTDAQQALITTSGSLFVEACPGAGKTWAIVERFSARAHQEKRKGIALLSFTNAAVDEVRARCADDPGLLGAPHFVGTFDYGCRTLGSQLFPYDVVTFFVVKISERAARQTVNFIIPEHRQDIQVSNPILAITD